MIEAMTFVAKQITFEMDKGNGCRVCVTAGSSYIGSSLVKRLLEKGYTVHATLRNLNDESKVSLLKSFPNAKTRLELFEADIYEPESFEDAIQGCQFVVHVAHPMFYSSGHNQHKNRVEAAVTATRSIASASKKSGTVKRLIYTASVTAASPLKEEGEGYKDFIDESCWTPFHIPVAYSNEYLKEYTIGKTIAEKDLLDLFNNNAADADDKNDAGGVEVVSLVCGLVGGETCWSSSPASAPALISPILKNEAAFHTLKYLDELVGKVPIVHIDDVVEAHIFCVEANFLTGRFLCASSYVSAAEIAQCFRQRFPEFNVPDEYLTGSRREIQWRSTRLTDKGFKYKYDNLDMILDDCVRSARRIGDLNI